MKYKLTLVTGILVLSIFNIHSQTTNPPFGPPSGKTWQVVNQLTDNFSSFDGNKWVKRNHDTGPEGHRWAGRKPGKIHASQSSVVNGKLRITATADYNPGDAQTNCEFWLKTGFVYSKAKAGIGYYTECSMRASDLSMASSFWLKLGTKNNQEIDVTETYGNGRNTRFWDDKIRTNTHVFLNGDNATNPKPITAGFKPKDRFHRVGMFWKTATQMDIYVDGAYKISMATKNGLKVEESLRLIFDMEAFVPECGSGPGAPEYRSCKTK
ncbi:family 16 glycosylhydrolase [Zobellia nedashkovskayae]